MTHSSSCHPYVTEGTHSSYPNAWKHGKLRDLDVRGQGWLRSLADHTNTTVQPRLTACYRYIQQLLQEPLATSPSVSDQDAASQHHAEAPQVEAKQH
jgi:hypothetical protein